MMAWSTARVTATAVLAVLAFAVMCRRWLRLNARVTGYLRHMRALFLFFAVTEWFGLQVSVWILGWLCFAGLREFLSLVDIRLQDRWGILGAYLSIPFMVYLIAIDWYGLFIISIPVYAFLIVPFLIVLGGPEKEGTVLSVGAIDLGLFMIVYCFGHIGYLTLFCTWLAMVLVLNVALCDLIAYVLNRYGRPPWNLHGVKYVVSIPLTVGLTFALTIPVPVAPHHAIILGAMIPALVAIGRYTFMYIEADLRISNEVARPGRGRFLDSISSSLYAAPVVFHYVRYFVLPEGH